MAIAVGSKIGPYEILGVLGEGGMGEVYRARDLRLGRDVAIKVSKEQFTERFDREARAVAALNHPNICHLYDVGPNYLVMEFIEGDFPQGPMPLEQALKIARQISDALEAAHEKGIVHRDLKPANIKIRPDGTVKVLDFGLAKMSAAVTQDADNSPTFNMSQTAAGMIVGTAAYMAPEQARGRVVDKRADIWAFGVVLYEMVTGKQLFQGEDLTDTLASVVKTEPDLSAAPQELRRLLGKCLQKNPQNRLRDIGDVWDLLDEVRVEAVSPAGVTHKSTWLWPAITAVAVVTALVITLWSSRRATPIESRPLVRFSINLTPEIDPTGSFAQSLAISPDGTRIAYFVREGNGSRMIYTQRLDQSKAVPLPGTQGVGRLFFSPDSQWIGFSLANQIKKVSANGGTAVPLHDIDFSLLGGDWKRDFLVLGSGNAAASGLYRLSADGADFKALLGRTGAELGLVFPDILPGGKAVIFTAPTQLGKDTTDHANVEVLSLESGQRKILVRGGSMGRYVSSGHLLYANHGTLFAVRFDPDTLEMRGTAVPVVDDLTYADSAGEVSFSVSENGTLVYRSGSLRVPFESLNTVQWLDHSGRKQLLIETPGGYSELRLSPDGTKMAQILNPGSNKRVSVYDLKRNTATALTFEEAQYHAPLWTADGRFVVWQSQRGLQWARADGSGRPQLIDADGTPFFFDPVGKGILVLGSGSQPKIFAIPVTDEGGQLKASLPQPVLGAQFNVSNLRPSPDAHWIAYQRNESGRPEISVRAFAPPSSGGGSGRFLISTEGGTSPVWSRNSSELFYQSQGRIMVVKYRTDGDQFISDPPKVWADLGSAKFWDMAPDGRALITVPVETTETKAANAPESNVVFLLNFFDELRRRVP